MAAMPVVVLTGSIRHQDRIEAIACGAKEYWTKPHEFSDFVSLVRDNFQRLLSGHLLLQ
jgi:DNA-binding response OmpR family regulator